MGLLAPLAAVHHPIAPAALRRGVGLTAVGVGAEPAHRLGSPFLLLAAAKTNGGGGAGGGGGWGMGKKRIARALSGATSKMVHAVLAAHTPEPAAPAAPAALAPASPSTTPAGGLGGGKK